MTADTAGPQKSARPRVTLDHVYVVAAVGVAIGAALATKVRPHDFWWHLAQARAYLATGEVASVDTFTYTQQGDPFFNQMWLSQLVMYGLYRAGGLAAVLLGHAAAIGVACALVARLCLLLTRDARLTAVVILGAVLPLSMSNWAVRPQPYAFPLFVIVVGILLARCDAGARRFPFNAPWLLPIVMAVWVNIHGSFALGLVLISLTVAVEAVRAAVARDNARWQELVRFGIITLLVWCATAVNPRGFSVLLYVARLMRSPSVAHASEWQPVSPTDLAGVWFLMVAAAVLLLLVYGRRRPSVTETTLIVVTLMLGALATRNTVWFALLCAPVAAAQAASLLPKRSRDDGIPRMNIVLIVSIVAGVALMSPWMRSAAFPQPLGALTADTPTAAVAHLAGMPDPPQRLFSDVGYSSYLSWAIPGQRTFVDTRFELFPEELIADTLTLSAGRHVEVLTARYDFDGFLVSKKYQQPLVDALRTTPGWSPTFEDAEAALFVQAD